MMENSARLLWPDFARTAAVAAVIVLHVAAVPVTRFASLPADTWWWAHGFDSLVRPCIPLFVMLSGALLLTRSTFDTARFIRRRITGVAIPFVAWSALYAAWNYRFHGVSITLGDFLRHLAAGATDPVYSHLWFLPLILGLYLLVPVLRVYVVNSTLANQMYFAALWLISTIAVPVAESHFGFPIGFYFAPVFGYVGYFVLGGTLYLHLPARVPTVWLAAAGGAFLAGYAATMWGTYVLTLRNAGQLDEYFYSYLSPSVIPMSVSAFLLLRDGGIRLQDQLAASASARKWIALAGGASFGIYLLHMIPLELLSAGIPGFSLGPLTFHPVFGITATSLLVFLLSFAGALLIRSTTWLRWLAP